MPARRLKPGDVIRDYTIEEEINVGAMAFAYRARSKSGRQIFLKKYKSPTVLVPWFRGFVEYQREMKRRIEASPFKNFACELIEFFEARSAATSTRDCYFQAYEFVSDGASLDKFLEELKKNPRKYTWEQRLTWAKVVLGSIATLHDAKIVHGDLKPPNIQLIRDTSIRVGYRVKLIDMDFSIFADRQAPWHGSGTGYVGSPTYYSPEHLTGGIPQPASDVFTTGIILYEMLADGHPYGGLDDETYKKSVLGYSAAVPRLRDRIPDVDDAAVVAIVHRMLSPDIKRRPTAKEVLDVLNGRGAPARPAPLPATRAPAVTPAPTPVMMPVPTPVAPKPTPPPTPTPTSAVGSLRLEHGPFTKELNVSMRINQSFVRGGGEESRFWDPDHQFTLDRRPDGWWVLPNLGAANETLVNGAAVTAPVRLASGDLVACGRAERSIEKLPLRVTIA